MYDVTALGEVLIDFTPHGFSEAGKRLFEQNPGGAPANVLAALQKLGLHTAFIGKVGDDMHGAFLKDTLEELGVNTEGLAVDPEYFTTLAFVTLENGERSFSFARKPGADTQLKREEVRTDILKDSRIFHFGSLSLTDEPARSATLYAVEEAKNSGVLISYDPNYRAMLWPDVETAMEGMRSAVKYVDIMKLSDAECILLTDHSDPEEAADVLLSQGVRCVVVTLGGDGALMKTKNFTVHVPVPPSSGQVVDTTGAGDSFWGGVLSCFVKEGVQPDALTLEQGRHFLRVGNVVAGLCVRKRGAIPAMPTLEEVMEVLRRLIP